MSPVRDDPNWPRASAWLGGEHAAEPHGTLAILGAPLHLASITPGRCDLAPGAIRNALRRFSTCVLEEGLDLRNLAAIDHGDLEIASMRPEDAGEPLAARVAEVLAVAHALVILGGDNSITRPGVRGAGASLEKTGLVTFDAHLDLRDLSAGLTNGNPVRALLADGLPGSNIVQIGIQSFANSPAYAAVAREAGIRVITADQAHARGIESVVTGALDQLARHTEAIYVDLDLDVLDRTFSPATPGSRPGGLAPWQIRRAAKLCGRHAKVKVLDLVEVDPTRDGGETTALAAAACLLSFAAGVLSRLSGHG